METPRWVDAWEELDTDEYCTNVLVDLEPMYPTIKKVSVFRNRPLEDDDGSAVFALRWATIHVQSGMFEEDFESDSDDDDV